MSSRGGAGLLLQDLHERVEWRFRAERRPAGQQLVEQRPQAVDVAGRPQLLGLAGGLLGRHVAGRAEDGPGARLGRNRRSVLGQAEVGDVRLVVRLEQDVGGLEVAVQDAVAVGVVDAPGHALT